MIPHKTRSFIFVILITTLLSLRMAVAGTTGKIAGQVTDAESGETLAGVNVYLEGTSLGSATDADGAYFIINILPGSYTLKVSYVGYQEYTVTDVKVQIDLTTRIDIEMQSEVLVTEAIVVVAEKRLVQKDVAASQKSVTSEQIEALPFTTIEGVVGLQAGVTSALSIRGSAANEVLFLVDGIALRDERTNDPITSLPLSAVQEISVQSGGFSAEYNNVRSGVVNVVTKEGNPDRYTGTISFKAKPPGKKHFGISPYDADSYFLRPRLDPEVAWVGTQNGSWDEFTRKQYPDFAGWNALSDATLTDDNPDNDLTPEAMQRIFLWQYRKQGDIKKEDYNIDAGFGGPVPFVSKALGNLRFYASYQRERDMYLMQLSRDALNTETYMMKVTSDISPSMKLSMLGIYSELKGTALSRSGGTSVFDSPYDIAQQIDRQQLTLAWRIYSDIYFAPTERYSHTASAKFTHVLSPSTFYDLQLKKVGRKYHTNTPRWRDHTLRYEPVPGYLVDEAPLGFDPDQSFSIDGDLAFGGAVSTSRDFSKVNTWSIKGDLVSQLDFHNQVKTGFEFVYNKFDMFFGQENKFLPEGNTTTIIKEDPYRLTAYVQDKIEYEGFISSLGLIMDYTNPNGQWFDVDDYDRDFYSQNFKPEDEAEFKNQKTKAIFTLSPRLTISHPITEYSKLYFNYGHYRQIPTSERRYRIQRSIINQMDFIGDPTNPLERTVQYELGYDHALSNQYLFHLAAYYKDITDQEFWVRYISFDGKVNYRKITNNSYEDIRGLELDITKLYGKWITGNINYEYRVGTSGYFGSSLLYEDPAEQREYLRRNPIQSKPRPTPRIKSYIDLHTPLNFGPEVIGQNILGDWHFNFISLWTAGFYDTWNPGNIPGIRLNVQWADFYNVDLRVSKVFPFKNFDLKFFADINNLTNHKDFSGESFGDSFDFDDYMKSLHMPGKVADELGYGNIPGDDRPGDYRKHGVAWQPMEFRNDIADVIDPKPQLIYYDAATKRYMQFSNEQWNEVSGSTLDKILDDKAYIDMPNHTFFTFLNPRNIFFGMTISYNF